MLVSAHELSKSFGVRPLFQGLTFSIETGERIGLIGPNGAGKSTLLAILAGVQTPDTGRLALQKGLKTGYLKQVPTFTPGATALETVFEGVNDIHDWVETSRAHEILAKLSIADDVKVDALSGGWKKRVALAREIARGPELLLLDEPTNHLDLESILWLEEFLANECRNIATVTVTHDRAFLQAVSTRIVELDRRNVGGILSISGSYADYLETKEQLISAQENQEIRLKNTLRRETEWLRRGAKARTTKQQARINRHGELSEKVEDLQVRNQVRKVGIQFQSTDRSPRKLIEAEGVSKSFGTRLVVPEFDLKLVSGSRVGILGTNGAGKSTLIRLLLGEEKPSTGTVTRADGLKVAYFEQNRESLDPEVTLKDTLCPRGEFVDFAGGRVHIRSYLSRFLFTPEQADVRVGKLSGGEQSRILIARLMLEPANLLVLDEPTNDLDIATLDVLVDVLQDFNGAILIVAHDRYFMDQVATQILALHRPTEDAKPVLMSFTGLGQWEDWIKDQIQMTPAQAAKAAKSEGKGGTGKSTKFGFKEKREFELMEATIATAEKKLESLSAESAKPGLSPSKLAEIAKDMGAAQSEIERLYARWSELEEIAKNAV